MHQAVPPPQRGATYSGYRTRRTPDHDTTLTHVGPGTPMGELMRRYWQPIARSADLGKRPLRLTILGEDLVLFRDGSGRLGLMHRHCTHRGAGLELGRIVERGIQCSLHGWWFDVDGTVLDTPAEPKNSPLVKTTTQGAYPVQETAGLIFAYLGPPEHQPAFPNLDAFQLPGTELVSYSLHYPCNWLQVHENLMDPLHAVFLHTRMGSTQITDAWGEMPITEYGELGDRMYYLTSRRFGDNVWVRFNEVSVPTNCSFSESLQRAGRSRTMTPHARFLACGISAKTSKAQRVWAIATGLDATRSMSTDNPTAGGRLSRCRMILAIGRRSSRWGPSLYIRPNTAAPAMWV